MQKINWDMMTQFVFPEQLGTVEEVVSCDIKPRWQQITTDDSVKLNGIYHITAVARFNPNQVPEYSDGTLIEELEFDGNNGYFEYALPFNVDLPREKVANQCEPELMVDDVSYFVYDGSNCTFKWCVNCNFEEPVHGGLFTHEPEKIAPTPIVAEPPKLPEAIPDPARSEYTEELRFGGDDGIFPEAPSLKDESPLQVEPTLQVESPLQEEPQLLQESPLQEHLSANEGQSLEENSTVNEVAVNSWKDTIESSSSSSSSSSMRVDRNLEFSDGIIVKDIDEKRVEELVETKVQSNQFFPTDTDDFYNELTESYTILNYSNKIRHE